MVTVVAHHTFQVQFPSEKIVSHNNLSCQRV
jgi:hypothetical protein